MDSTKIINEYSEVQKIGLAPLSEDPLLLYFVSLDGLDHGLVREAIPHDSFSIRICFGQLSEEVVGATSSPILLHFRVHSL